MANRTSDDEKRRVMLRTTADVMLNSVNQLEWCVKDWPQYSRECEALKELIEPIVAAAREVGYIGRGLNANR